MNSIARFKQSYAVLQKFYEAWLVRVAERCKGNDQRQAAYYVWARYSMSMRTIAAILDPHLIPDLWVVCRGCLEFSVTLEAVIKDASAACEFLEFEKHARAHYLRILGKQGDIDRLLARRNQFDESFDEVPEHFRQTSWCVKRGGITGLMRTFGRTTDLRLYNMLSHFAHGSIWAMQMLDGNEMNPQKTLEITVDCTYARYLNSSREFIGFVWEPLATPEGEQCKGDFIEVVSAHDAEAT